MADQPDIPQIPRPKARHRMRGLLTWPSVGARRAGRDLLTDERPPRSGRRVAVYTALVASLIVAGVGSAAIPGRWKAASAKTTPTPAGGRVIEATVGSIKRTLVLDGLVVREADEEVRTSATGTLTQVNVKPG